MAQVQSLIPKSRSTPVGLPRSQAHLVRLAIEPTGEEPYAEAMREWIERVSEAPRRSSLRIVR